MVKIYIVKRWWKKVSKMLIDLNKDGNLIIKDNNDSIRELCQVEVSIRGVKGLCIITF